MFVHDSELSLFLTTQHGWHPETGPHAYIDFLGFTALGLREQATHTDS